MRCWTLWVSLFLVVGLGAPAAAEPDCGAADHAIIVHVNNVRSAAGLITATVYGNKAEKFLKKEGKLVRVRVPARKGSVDICLPVAKPGVYAVTVYHDENGNRDFDKSWFGIPEEGYGISNNPKIVLAPPDFSDAEFKAMNGRTRIDINVHY
ncbi:MAG: DUF2141 domain-containing protein [Alphaproteobacteria bacterium]